jgi:hypothetical protein
MTAAERKHVARIKAMPCAVCHASPPSDAHHIEQALNFLVLPLCKDCHQGSHNGIHGQKRIWAVLKKTELSALNETIEKLVG